MRIWIDADACPREIKQIVFRASARLEIPVVLVANLEMKTPRWPLVSSVRVRHGAEEADEYIAEEAAPDDIVITADIPLAAQIVGKGAIAIDPRGELYNDNTVHDRLATRNLLDQLRGSGLVHGGPTPLRASDRGRFAATLDRELTKRARSRE